MSAYSGATSGGYNQSGGNYFIVLSTISPGNILQWTGGSGSGGATAVGNFSTYQGLGPNENFSTAFGAGRIIKDMGKTVVSSGRAFRKFQAAITAATSTGGVTGASSTTYAGYMTAYLEVAAPNGGGLGPAALTLPNVIARYY